MIVLSHLNTEFDLFCDIYCMKKILVIEDTPDILENIAEILELANYEVITAPNGKVGVEQALNAHPDLIVCDIMMPELDGYGVLHMVQKHEALRLVPFIFLTAKAEASDFRKGMGLGADDYLVKPFEPTDLLQTIESRLKKADVLGQQIQQAPVSQVNTEQVLKDFVEGRQIYTYRKKQILFSEGNHPSRIFYVITGKVKIYKTNDEGKELIVNLATTGDFIGYTAVWQGTTYKVTAEAIEDVEVAAIARSEFEQLLKENPGIQQYFLQALACEVEGKDEQLLRIAYNSLRRKVADALIFLHNKYKQGEQQPFSISISRENLASLAGTATESLIRTLSDFKNEKLIDIHDGKIILLNEKKINQMIN